MHFTSLSLSGANPAVPSESKTGTVWGLERKRIWEAAEKHLGISVSGERAKVAEICCYSDPATSFCSAGRKDGIGVVA